MLKNFSAVRLGWPPRNATGVAQSAVVLLMLLNLVAAYFLWRPPGGSAEQLEDELVRLRAQVIQKRIVLERTRQNVSKVETGRSEGDMFMQNYFLGERTAYSNVLGELVTAAKDAKIRSKEHAFTTEPIEGSDTLAMMTITGNYEGTYADLMEFINRIDRSQRLLIIESLNATPQQGSAGILNVNMKLEAFVRQDTVAE